jgi:hypothetical protein
MSMLRGDPGSSTWTLPSSIDALAAAARQAGRPSSAWLAGIAYQLVVLGWFSGAAVAGPVLQGSFMEVGAEFLSEGPLRWSWLPGLEHLAIALRRHPANALFLLPLILLLFRVTAGLILLTPTGARGERTARVPGLRKAWRGGRGATLSGLALWVQFVLMMFGATLLFVGPAQLFVRFVHLDKFGALTAILAGVLIGLLMVYSFLLSILFQIALHSLVRNRRGVGSAVQHAWRIARNDPMGAGRAAAADAVLTTTVVVLQVGLTMVTALLNLPQVVLWVPTVALLGFAGLARCAFWAQVYQALGGLSTLEEGMPGGAAPQPSE